MLSETEIQDYLEEAENNAVVSPSPFREFAELARRKLQGEDTDRRLDEAIERRHFPCEHEPEVGSGGWWAEKDGRNV